MLNKQFKKGGKRMGEKRDIQRIMEREIRKGSCPLRFEGMEFQRDAYRPVLAEKDLEDAFDYLLRLGKFRWYIPLFLAISNAR